MMNDDTAPERGWRLSPQIIRASLPVVELAGCAILFWGFWSYFTQARDLPRPLNQIDIGAGGFPVLLAVAALLVIPLVAIAAVIRMTDAVPVEWVAVKRPLYVIVTVMVLIAQSIWFEQLGAMPSVVLFSAATMLACGERRIVHLIGVPLALAAFIYGVFIMALSVNLP
jgi:hypothetical protein